MYAGFDNWIILNVLCAIYLICSKCTVCQMPWKNKRFSHYIITFFSSHIFLVMLLSLWDLSSPTRDWTQALAVEALSPNHWTTRAFPLITLIVHISTCTLLVKGHTPWYVLMPTTYFEMCPSQKDGTDWNTVDRQTENYTIKEIY